MNKALVEYVVKENACIIQAYFKLQSELLKQIDLFGLGCDKKDLAELLDRLNDNNAYLWVNKQVATKNK